MNVKDVAAAHPDLMQKKLLKFNDFRGELFRDILISLVTFHAQMGKTHLSASTSTPFNRRNIETSLNSEPL